MPSLAEQIVEACRAMRRLGLTVATTGNASAREGDRVLISPTSLDYDAMTPADVVAIDLEGRRLEGSREPSSEWRVHCAIYARRPDVAAIVHAHSPHAVAWSFLGDELDTGSEEMAHYCGGPVRTAGFAPTGTDEIAGAAVDALGDRHALLLERHGIVACGSSLQAALDVCAVVEAQAQVAWLLRNTGPSTRAQ